MGFGVLAALSGLLVVLTLLPLSRCEAWWVRGLDFPRLQLAGLAVALLAVELAVLDCSQAAAWGVLGTTLASLLYQASWILPYTPFFPKEVAAAAEADPGSSLRILAVNVLTPNRNAEGLLEMVRRSRPDVLVAVETDGWWERRLDALEPEYPHVMRCPLENLYGMHVYSRLPLEDARIQFLVQDDIPSMHAVAVLPSGRRVRMHFLHPAPPSPTENPESSERDAELIVVGKSVAEARLPVVVTGDLNDVAWSATTRLFRKVSGLLDPRVGRGMFNTFHAEYPFLRWPLDHVFHSRHFTLARLERLPAFGSDHFPILVDLVLAPERAPENGGGCGRTRRTGRGPGRRCATSTSPTAPCTPRASEPGGTAETLGVAPGRSYFVASALARPPPPHRSRSMHLPFLRPRRLRAGLLAAAVLAAGPLPAQERLAGTEAVFGRYADHVVKLQVVETGSAARASTGSGFFVSAGGHLVTNYHVVSQVVHDPGRYRAELLDAAGTPRPVAVLAVDVVHDLAVLRADLRPRRFFTLGTGGAVQGNRLYSLGHPSDLGLSIVEGTYNGLLRHTLYPKIHFTGSINPGMSGGPTIAADGSVVGVNVSTAGNQLSFLVPADRAAALVARATAPGYRPPASLLAEVGRQVHASQDVYLRELFAGRPKTVALGPYRVPTEPAPFFRCWGDARRSGELPYEIVDHDCSTDDYLFVAGGQESGVVAVTHQLVSTRTLNRSRFFALYTRVFQEDNTPGGDEEHVTSWRCGTRNLRNAAATPMRATLCVRRYRKLGELYDAVLKVAVLGRRDTGLVSTLTLAGVSHENVGRVTARYLESITWR
ncbi:MAG TPA: endonuclease/exonuclease/phosphatase family protein [Longimicrobiaceae bacterium]|nr:endonuclease/exonuclease/phosphatase family protein [Longimicrobiaceae bacterium]